MISRRSAELAWSCISDLGCNPQGAESSVIMTCGQGLGRSMIVVDVSARATTIHHDHGFRAERPHSITSRRGAGLAELSTSESGRTSRYSKKPGHGPGRGSRLDADVRPEGAAA